MAARDDMVSTTDVARRLGITVQRVNRLAEEGAIIRVARGLIDAASVDRYIAERRGTTRAWAPHTAWAAIALLSGIHVDWLGPTQTWRVRNVLAHTDDPADLVARTRDRATVHTFSGHPTALTRLAQDLVSADTAGLGLAEAGAPRVDGYLASDLFENTVRFLGLIEDAAGPATVRVTDFDIAVVSDLATNGLVLAALDAATSLDPRERGVGERALAAALETYGR